ncbi:MAG: citrate synthase family protein [Stellaceae bacterium]
MQDNHSLTAREAAERLGIKLETLYAYVSRGRLRSVPVSGSRERRYRPEDIDALQAARGAPRGGVAPAAQPPSPVIDSSISLIEGGRLYYRGRDVLRLSDRASLEEIAALLWNEPDGGAFDATAAPAPPRGGELQTHSIERCQIRLAEMAAADPEALDLKRARVARAGRGILAELIAAAGGYRTLSAPVHRRLASGWGLDDAGADILRRSLVLLADHELNPSTFVARCVASTGATPYAVVSAALGALSGRRHGGAAIHVAELFRELARGGDPMIAMAERLAHGEALPGIGHPLYPDGDPRAVAILYAVSAIAPQARRFVRWQPNVDFALAAATTALGLPPDAALALFAIGRTVGWIAHAIEQYDSGVPIRPRARYTGPRPEGSPGP